MVVAVFVRRLRAGCSFEDFKSAWEAERGFGVPARVFSAVSLADPRDVLTVGFVDVEPDELERMTEDVATQEQVRHERIEEVIESTELRAIYELRGEHDFSADPRELETGSAESLPAGLRP
jgi:hypothetical protein